MSSLTVRMEAMGSLGVVGEVVEEGEFGYVVGILTPQSGQGLWKLPVWRRGWRRLWSLREEKEGQEGRSGETY